jgi:hypothetical protein
MLAGMWQSCGNFAGVRAAAAPAITLRACTTELLPLVGMQVVGIGPLTEMTRAEPPSNPDDVGMHNVVDWHNGYKQVGPVQPADPSSLPVTPQLLMAAACLELSHSCRLQPRGAAEAS